MFVVRYVVYIIWALFLTGAIQPIFNLTAGWTVSIFITGVFSTWNIIDEKLIPRYQKWCKKNERM